ncbi:Na+/H+ antiporter NhaC [Sediminicola luteus]|uniref:Na+/H+ antiporter NhaC n=1 Tax=Sediminicola luteus TaxID=319238 RepID=A0A2A4G6Y0_9FLAO|nr:Na+/H+ antiporter NhaC [Sediminicola luteus]PCE64193.1 Na+/H+ antiporter NhaC [Sediminicola luteus]
MQESDYQAPPGEEVRKDNYGIGLGLALVPVLALVAMLAYNVYVFGDDALSGSNQFILLMGAAVAAAVGAIKGVPYKQMMGEVANNLKSTTGALMILLMVGALSGTWLISGVIPAMIYYGLQILNPTIFLAACVVICAVISIATGSSWTTSATVGIALVGIGEALGISLGMTAGAILSGAYFGDKMSPLSDTTNLAPAMAGGELFSHIRYMSMTTVPTFLVTLIVFVVIGLGIDTQGVADSSALLASIKDTFYISGWLFLVPIAVVALILKKAPPLMALLVGVLLAAVFAIIFQPDVLNAVTGASHLSCESAYEGIMKAITVKTQVATENEALLDLFASKGMEGMMTTIWLIMCAMAFGGVMDGIGALSVISEALLSLATSTFSLFASTVASCLALNVTASDQYLALVVPGKMFAKAYKDRGLAPENLSRTLEDSGTVTSVLVPWNTCGAYHSGVLGVPVVDYFVYAFFNWMSPITTLIFAGLNIRIKQLRQG